MEHDQTRVLLIEDNPGDARLIKELLSEAHTVSFEVELAERLSDGLEALSARRFDVVLLDLSLPDSSGLDTLTKTLSTAQQESIIMLTGLDDEDIAVEAVRKGAQDYLVKGQIDESILSRAIRYAMERKKSEEQIRLHQEQLFQASKMASLGTLVSGVAHEINDPIAYIMLNAPILQKVWAGISPILDEHRQKTGEFYIANMSYTQVSQRMPLLLSGIIDGAMRVGAIVSDLKDFARQSPPELTDMLDINKEVKKAIGLLANLIKKSTRHFSVSYEPDVPLLKGNPQRIEQAIINLLVNACQALSDDTKGISVSTTYNSKSDCIVIEVRDEGEGMPPEVLERIKDPFFTTKRHSVGSGLGLAISDGIVQDHGGTMAFASTPGEGTTVKVSFPAAVAS